MAHLGKKKQRRVLVVCHGNICRSPLAATVISSVHSCLVRSRGFVNPGKLAAKKVRDWAISHGYSLAEHRSQLVSVDDVDWADVILYMDGGNKRRLLVQFPHTGDKLTCLAVYSRIGVNRIPDPNYMRRGSRDLRATLEMIEACAKAFAKEKPPVVAGG